ncbi:hypothetical protein [Heyndrickxia acidiproducens]|uniref:hypothetical protein n=1 Tax=Heyndrickxia acidiproducens TaxID=1121084 RepID=UPI003BF4B03E
MAFSVPIIAIVTNFLKGREKLKLQIVEKELELEKLKNENYLLETEKMKQELKKLELDEPEDQWGVK